MNWWTQTSCLLGLVIFPVGCAGDKFSDCTSGACAGDAQGGEAGAASDTNGATSGDVGNPTSSIGSSSAGGSGGSGGAGSSGGAGNSSDGSPGATTYGEAGGGSFSEGGAGATGTCEDTCDGTCCDEFCVDLESDPDHCGACGTGCELANAQATCVAGSCMVSACQDEKVDCNGEASDGCEVDLAGFPEAPGLRRPMFGAYTGSLHAREAIGSLRPEFAWEEVEPITCSAVSYQLQVEGDCPLTGFAGCDFPSPELDVSGLLTPEFVPETDLPVEEEQAPVGRRYYWRVRACESSDVCSEWSEVFYADVGRLREDVTGDGYADLVAARVGPENDYLFHFRGDGDFAASHKLYIVPMGEPPLDNATLSFVGDVNGDGFNDVGGACRDPNSDTATQYLWPGGTVFGEAPPITVGTSANVIEHVAGLWAGGDFDRDGYADMVLGKAPTGNDFQHFFKQGGASLPPENGLEIGPMDDSEGASEPVVHGVTSGDFNADGYPDFALDAGRLQSSARFVFGHAKAGSGLERTIEVFPDDNDARPIMATLDFNGDHIDDLAVLSRSEGRLVVVFGSSDLDTEADPEIWSEEFNFAPSDLAVGDLDQTGFDDVVVSGPMIFEGESEPDTTPYGYASEDGAEGPVAIADHNGDGYLDLVLGNFWYEGVVMISGQYVELPGESQLDGTMLAH